MYQSIAQLRRLIVALLIVNSGFGLFCLAVLLILGKSVDWGNPMLIVGIIAHLALVAWLFIDMIVTLHLLRNTELLKPSKPNEKISEEDGQKFISFFFREGVTWTYLRSIIEKKEVEKEERFREAERVEREREYRLKALQKKTEEEERERRRARRIRETTELQQQGVALGVPEATMQALVEKDAEFARAAVARKEREKELTERATRNFCFDIIRPFLQSGELDEAEAVIIRASNFIERAVAFDAEGNCGMETQIRLAVAQDDLPLAEKKLTAAAEKRRFENLQKTFDVRIESLPPHNQPRPREILERLCAQEYGSRQFRKILHDLERTLAG